MDCLIVSCSQRKRPEPGPAIVLYDGNLFRILRKHRPRIDLFVYSAKYGLIPATEVIEPYDQKITGYNSPSVFGGGTLFQINQKYANIYVCMGDNYLEHLKYPYFADWKLYRIPNHTAPIGQMQAALKKFCLAHQKGPTPEWHKCLSE